MVDTQPVATTPVNTPPVAAARFEPRLAPVGRRVRFAAPHARLRVIRGTKRLVSAVSHDFAQPLATVASLADLLATDGARMTEDARHDLAARLDASARRLAARFGHIVVMMDVLAKRVIAGNTVEVRSAVEEVLATIEGQARIGVSGPRVRALMDQDHLEHVLATLLRDAIAYGLPPVRVRVIPAAGSVRIEIVDHGQNVIRRVRAHVWSPATGRWTVLSRQCPAVRALGLAITARLVATDGGALIRRPMRRSHGERVVIRLAIAPV